MREEYKTDHKKVQWVSKDWINVTENTFWWWGL
jgi:hypothetical protein